MHWKKNFVSEETSCRITQSEKTEKGEWKLTSDNTVKWITQMSDNTGFTVYVYDKS